MQPIDAFCVRETAVGLFGVDGGVLVAHLVTAYLEVLFMRNLNISPSLGQVIHG